MENVILAKMRPAECLATFSMGEAQHVPELR